MRSTPLCCCGAPFSTRLRSGLLLTSVLLIGAGCSAEHDRPGSNAAPTETSSAPVIAPPAIRPQLKVEEVGRAASANLRQLLSFVPGGHEKEHGFNHRSELSRAMVGTPLAVYTVAPFDSADHPSGWSTPLAFTNAYRAPVLVDGAYRCLATVAPGGSAWETVEVGATALAHELEQVEAGLPEKLRGLPLAWLRVFQLYADFVLVMAPEDPSSLTHAIALRSATLSLRLTSSEPMSPQELTAVLSRGFATWRDGKVRP